jgi:hypothetical protein
MYNKDTQVKSKTSRERETDGYKFIYTKHYYCFHLPSLDHIPMAVPFVYNLPFIIQSPCSKATPFRVIITMNVEPFSTGDI